MYMGEQDANQKCHTSGYSNDTGTHASLVMAAHLNFKQWFMTAFSSSSDAENLLVQSGRVST